jgi:hypothetical protein
MTLILARASAEFVLQVTDRLTTIQATKQPFDKIANKNILYFASNAVIALAYTGDAYLEDIPTDHWIAEKLAGIKINLKSAPAMISYKESQRDVGLTLKVIKDELDKLVKRIQYLVISIQGWQWDSSGKLRPLVGDISKVSIGNAFNIRYEPRNWWAEGASMTIAAPPSNISQEELTDLSNSLRHKSAVEAEGALVEKIRELSQRNSIIGPHCISITIPPPSNPNIVVRYLPESPSNLPESQRLTDDQLGWAFSPWIVSSKICIPPAQIIGNGFTASTGFFSIQFISETPENPNWLLMHQGQKRRKYP